MKIIAVVVVTSVLLAYVAASGESVPHFRLFSSLLYWTFFNLYIIFIALVYSMEPSRANPLPIAKCSRGRKGLS